MNPHQKITQTHTHTHTHTGALERSGGRDYGLSMLWNLMIEPSASSNVAEAARHALSKLLVKAACRRPINDEVKQSRLESYLDKCICSVQLKNSTAYVPQCLRLALNILTHSTVSEKIQRERLIRDVNARQECVKELISFLQLANEAKIS